MADDESEDGSSESPKRKSPRHFSFDGIHTKFSRKSAEWVSLGDYVRSGSAGSL